ncbi:MAG: phospholipase D-like domain-containing protein [Gemmatimonas sp.]
MRKKNAELRHEVGEISPAPDSMADIKQGATAVFSPRSGEDVLELYAAMVDGAQKCACITLAFGINKAFKAVLEDNTADDHIVFVSYIHSKFLLVDPLGDDPIVITGSANFSEPSVTDNEESMLFIRGDARVADIYFTEFNRLFNHYYFRSVLEATHNAGTADDAGSLFLAETPGKWLAKYSEPTMPKSKRLKLFAEMTGAARIT